MQPISVKVLAAAIGAPCDSQEMISHISTDSRDITKGCLFVCIEGERFDGHTFAQSAIEAGAALVVAHRELPLPKSRVLYVKDTMTANIQLAGAYRKGFSPLSVGVTGSVGKTTTKEFIYSVLCKQYKTLKTQGNHNNEIGVPKTLCLLDESYSAMVIEMGMNKKGDIDKLAAAVLPDIGVVTNVGTSHIELLGSRENILDTKLEIQNHMKPGAPLIVCADNDLLSTVKSEKVRIVRCGVTAQNLDYRAQEIIEQGGATSFVVCCKKGRFSAYIPTIGRHNVYNALIAFAVGQQADIPVEDILEGLRDYAPSGQRQKIVQTEGCTVVEDCYNASPDSMRAALFTLAGMDCAGRRIAVLGDMLELGDTAREAHVSIGRCCKENGINALYAFGENAALYVAGAKEAGLSESFHFTHKEPLIAALLSALGEGDILWVKASRGMKLEEVITGLYQGMAEKNKQTTKGGDET